MKWLAILVGVGAMAAAFIWFGPSLHTDLGEDIGASDSIRTAAITAAEGITERALEAAAAVELTADLATDINERFAQACDYQAVLHTDLGLEFRYTEGVIGNGEWRVEPRCEAVPR